MDTFSIPVPSSTGDAAGLGQIKADLHTSAAPDELVAEED